MPCEGLVPHTDANEHSPYQFQSYQSREFNQYHRTHCRSVLSRAATSHWEVRHRVPRVSPISYTKGKS